MYETEDEARGYFSLAIMADAVGKTDEAEECYRKARDRLVVLRQQHPTRHRFGLALAECDADIARLTTQSDRDEAARLLEEARAIRQQLAVKYKNDPAYQIHWMEAELNSAMIVGFEAAPEHLHRAATINQSLSNDWPTDPLAVYRLTCFLTGRDIVLVPTDAESAH
jgi:tetratricopeptide (TPR) repeat protein